MNKNWSNTVLVAYSALPKIVKEIDFGVQTRVKSSFRSLHLRNGISTEQLIGEIAELNKEKCKMVNIRFIVSEALEYMSDRDRDILIARIFEKKTFQEISDNWGISLRTVFRRLERAEESFAHELALKGYTEKWLEKEYGTDRYIAPLYARLNEEKYTVAKNL